MSDKTLPIEASICDKRAEELIDRLEAEEWDRAPGAKGLAPITVRDAPYVRGRRFLKNRS